MVRYMCTMRNTPLFVGFVLICAISGPAQGQTTVHDVEAEDVVVVAPHLENGWSFNFQDAPWTVVLKNFAQSAGFSMQFLSEPTGTFSYYDEKPYSLRGAIDVFNDYLLQRGFILIRDETKLTVASTAKQIPDNLVPFVSVHQLHGLGRNELASVALPLQNTDGAAEEIQQLLSPVGRVRTLSNSGRVIVTDTGTYLRRIRDLMLGSGIAAGNVDTVVVQLRHSLADDVADAINNFLSGNAMLAPTSVRPRVSIVS